MRFRVKVNFENVTYFSLLVVLTISLFVFKKDREIVYLILGALLGAFTKGNLEKKEDE